MLDRRWHGLDDWVGGGLTTMVHGSPNPVLMRRVRSYQWRVRERDVYKQLRRSLQKSKPIAACGRQGGSGDVAA